MLFEHERRGHHHAAELGECGCNEPELVVATQYDHYEIAALKTMVGKEVSRLIRPAFHVTESECMLFAFWVAPDHRSAVGLALCDFVHDIVAEIEVLWIMHVEVCEYAIVVLRLFDVA